MSLGSSSLKCEGEEWVREDSCSQGGVVPEHCMLVVLHVGVCVHVSLYLWFRSKMHHSRKLPLVWLFATYPAGTPLIQKGGKMAPGSWCGHSKEK